MSVSPWQIAEWPDEADPVDVRRAAAALADEQEPLCSEALGEACGHSGRAARSWLDSGATGAVAKLLHCIIWLDEHNVDVQPLHTTPDE